MTTNFRYLWKDIPLYNDYDYSVTISTLYGEITCRFRFNHITESYYLSAYNSNGELLLCKKECTQNSIFELNWISLEMGLHGSITFRPKATSSPSQSFADSTWCQLTFTKEV